MKTGQNVLQRCLVGVVCAFLCSSALAATAAEQLDEAVELFRAAKYDECRELLASMDAKDLTPQQAQRRTELAEEVATAINRSSKAQRDLQDAERALEAADLVKAAEFFKGVEQNEYASPEQKERARNGLALIKRRQDLEQKLQDTPPATRPADASAVAATRPAAEQPQTVGADPEARLERDRALAAQAIEVGNNAIRREQYDLAERKFQEALRLVPGHPAAVEGLELVRQHREAVGQPNLLDKTQQRQRAAWQRTEVLYQNNQQEIRQAINEKEFAEARRKLEVTRRLVEAGREDAQPPDRYTLLIRELDALGRFIDEAQRDFEQAQAAQQRAAARSQEQDRRRRDEQDRQERISKLLEQAMQLQKEHEYEKAADILREILAIDPTFQRAEWMLSVLYDANLIKKQMQIREKIYQQVQQALAEAEEARTPELTGANNRVYAFPSEDEWRIISQRDPYSAGVVSEDEANRATRDKLKEIVPSLDFPEGTSFEEVLNAIREMSNLSIDVNWNALGILGIDRATDTLGLRVTNVKYETALNLLLANVGGPEALLDYDVRDGVVRISTKEDLDTHKITRVYDVSDLLIRLPSFRAPTEDQGFGGGLGGFGGGGFGGGGFGGGGFGGGGFGGGGFGGGSGGFGSGSSGDDDDDDASEEQRQEIIEDLEEMIKEQIEPDTWEPEGTVGSLRIWNDRMIVRHTSRTHQEIQELFKQLRDDAQSLQVAVESKVVQLRSNFLEQIGVDLDVVLNQGNAGLDNGLVEGEDGTVFARDPITGVPLLMPRRFTQLGIYPAVPGAGTQMDQTALLQPYQNVALVPTGSSSNYWSRHTTPTPILNNSLGLAAPRTTGVPGSLAGDATTVPAFQIFGSFLDNIQVDFLLRATQMDARSSIVDAPRLVTPNNRGGYIEVNTLVSYVAQPGFLPAGGSGVGGQATAGRDPSIGTLPRGRTLDVTPTVSADRKYVTLTVRPRITDVRLSTFAGATGPLQVPEFDITEIRTSVNVPDRGWVLLGGLKLAGETEIEAGVPMLSKIPVLKRAFTNRSKVKDEFVNLFLLKPTIIIQGEQEKTTFDNLISADNGG